MKGLQEQIMKHDDTMPIGVRAMFAATPLGLCWEINAPIGEQSRHNYLHEVAVNLGSVVVVKNAPVV